LAKLKDEIGDLRNESTTAIFLMAKINFFYSENGKNWLKITFWQFKSNSKLKSKVEAQNEKEEANQKDKLEV